MSRKSKAIPLKPIVLVYCEGDSEKAYFEMLRHKYHARNVHAINIEVWILMHFEPVFRSYSTLELNQKLSSSKYFNLDYEHFKGQPYDHFLFDRVNIAVTNAQKLRHQQKGLRWYDRDPFTNIDQYLTDIFGVTEY